MIQDMSTQTHETWIPEWTFGDRLRKVRRVRRINQEQAAAALGVTAPQIAAWESGGNNPRDIVTVAKRCHAAWGVPAEWMLGLDVPEAPHPGPGADAPVAEAPADTSAPDALTRQKLHRQRRAGSTERYLAPAVAAA